MSALAITALPTSMRLLVQQFGTVKIAEQDIPVFQINISAGSHPQSMSVLEFIDILWHQGYCPLPDEQQMMEPLDAIQDLLKCEPALKNVSAMLVMQYDYMKVGADFRDGLIQYNVYRSGVVDVNRYFLDPQKATLHLTNGIAFVLTQRQ